MFLLIVLFGLAALGLALALYLQADIPQKPLPAVKPPAISAQPANAISPAAPEPGAITPVAEPEAAAAGATDNPATSAAPAGDAPPVQTP
jgi:hypothetical protein